MDKEKTLLGGASGIGYTGPRNYFDSEPMTTTGPTYGGVANRRTRSTDLKEQMFGEKSQLDFAKFSLTEKRAMLDQSLKLEQATLNRAKYEQGIKQNISAAAAIGKMATLEPSDPKFSQKVAQIAGAYPEALGSKAFQTAMEDRRKDQLLFQTARDAKSAAAFNNPQVAASYTSALAASSDPGFANAMAKATEAKVNTAKKLATNPDLSPEDRAGIYDPQKGQFNLENLDQLEVKAGAVAAQRKAQSENIGVAGKLSAALTHLQSGSVDETPELKSARETTLKNLQGYMSQIGVAFPPTSVPSGVTGPPPTGPSALDGFLSKHLGDPAVTPAEAASTQLAATPTGPDETTPLEADNTDETSAE
ncbi:MAG: hypothetical protein H0W66_00965 [Chthoniobacterales bacterium]|nr:hypothetical protein [Chthoniobacterales bacterium]